MAARVDARLDGSEAQLRVVDRQMAGISSYITDEVQRLDQGFGVVKAELSRRKLSSQTLFQP